MIEVSIFLFSFSCLSLFLVFWGYPFLVFVLSKIRPKPHKISLKKDKKVSVILACYGENRLLEDKIKNFLLLDYPNLEFIICFDGPKKDLPVFDHRIRAVSLEKRMGKAYALNKAVEYADGKFLLFTDVDAIFEKDVVRMLIRHFDDPKIGGVFGKRRIGEKKDSIGIAQNIYIFLDSFLKEHESKIGSTTSNDGKIYMIRKELFESIDPKSTDDLYCALSIIKKGKRFIFEKDAICYIKKPSRSFLHEIKRRKRIVSRSMRAIWLNRELLNPFKYGIYSFGLFVNKVLRRFLGIFLLLILISSGYLSNKLPLFKEIFILQCAFYFFAVCYPLFAFISSHMKPIEFIEKISATFVYIIAGAIGSILGIWGFLRGDIPSRWEPKKN